MTHYYLYIAAGEAITPDSDFFKVGVGTSKQSDRDLLYLIANAADNGHFFHIWSAEIDDFLTKIRQSLDYDVRPVHLVKARDLVRAFKARSSVPLNASTLQTAIQQRKALDLNYRIQSIFNRNSSGKKGSAKGNT